MHWLLAPRKKSLPILIAVAIASMALVIYCYPPCPQWQQVAAEWSTPPSTTRAMTVRMGSLYVGVGSPSRYGAEIYRLEDGLLRKFGVVDAERVATLNSDATGNLYVGAGTSHRSGAALFGRYDASNVWTTLKIFPAHSMVYSSVWHNGKLYLGLMYDDEAGTAEVWCFDGDTFVKIGGG